MRFIKNITVFSLIIFCIISTSTSLFSEQIRIPTKEILEVWEFSCIKHLKDGNIKKAKQVLKVMNWQCDNKQYLTLDDMESFELAQNNLGEARKTQNKYVKAGKEWICYNFQFYSKIKSAFIEGIGKQVLDIFKNIGIDENVALVVISQIVLETAWGKRIYGNNLFNIKGKYDGQSVDFTTHEQLKDGRWVKIIDSFRKYPTIEDSIKDYLKVLKSRWTDSYKALFSSDRNAVNEFISGLRVGQKGGYATDKVYEGKILTINRQVKELLSGSSLFPTYLKCLGREEELKQILRSKQ